MRNQEEIENHIRESLEKTRKYLQLDGGDVVFVRFEPATGVVEVSLLGQCADCPMSLMTLRAGIEKVILKDVPEARRVENVR
ncbi:MAG: NifU family protein [Chloroflexota bacterium]